jgi:DNA-binding CsgD family transcriptional regulator
MEGLLPRDYDTILHIAKIANVDLEMNNLRTRVLEELQKAFHANILTFFLADSKKRLSLPVLRDGDPAICRKYLDYYYQFDPMSPSRNANLGKGVLRYNDIISYSEFVRTEYYNDFLAPQPIHFGMILYLKSHSRLLGRISIFRPRRDTNFSEREVIIARRIAPHVSFALENAKMYEKMKEERDFFRIIDQCSLYGILILNERIEPIFSNQRAREFIELLRDKGKLIEDLFPPEVKEDCLQLAEALKHGEILPLPRSRVIFFSPQHHFSFRSQVIHQNFGIKPRTLFMVSIEKLNWMKVDENALQEIYQLTGREIEIVTCVVEGLKNAEIADRLFISELTVKKHIQNIFEKMEVNNRTSLIRKVLPLSAGFIGSAL